MDFVREYWLLILIAIVIVAIVSFLLSRPKQSVRLSAGETPLRPHMQSSKVHEGRGLAAEAAAAIGDVGGQFINAPIHESLPGASGPPDDLTRLKGVGPKFARLLNDLGITRYAQLAGLGDGDIDRLNAALGPFAGRLDRDKIPLQADYLARGDIDGYEQRFGKL